MRDRRCNGKGGSYAHPLWTEEEVATLRACYGVLPLAEIAARLPGRSPIGVLGKARALRLSAVRLRLHQVATMLGVNDYTARRWVQAGVLHASRYAATASDWHHIAIRRGDLLDFLREYPFLYEPFLIADRALREYVAALPPARERWYTPKEAAAFLAIDDRLVRKWIRRGDLPALAVGGRYWVRERDLRAFRRPVCPSFKGLTRREFGQSRERLTLRERNLAALDERRQAYGRRNATGPVAVPG